MIISERMSKRVRHILVRLIVYGITGSIVVILSEVLLSTFLRLEGSLWTGPWSFRVAYFILIPPSYSIALVAVGTLFGQRSYFTKRVMKIWGWPLKLIGLVPKFNQPGQPRDQ